MVISSGTLMHQWLILAMHYFILDIDPVFRIKKQILRFIVAITIWFIFARVV